MCFADKLEEYIDEVESFLANFAFLYGDSLEGSDVVSLTLLAIDAIDGEDQSA